MQCSFDEGFLHMSYLNSLFAKCECRMELSIMVLCMMDKYSITS